MFLFYIRAIFNAELKFVAFGRNPKGNIFSYKGQKFKNGGDDAK